MYISINARVLIYMPIWHLPIYGRLATSDTDFDFLSDTAVLHFDTDFSYTDGEIIVNHMMSFYVSQNFTV